MTAGSSFSGTVDVCYTQDGSESAFVGTITSADGFNVGDQFKIHVQDNGNGGSGDPDRFRVQVGAEGTLGCDTIGSFPAERTSGNLRVHS